ncbi:MAG TPA: metallophosphoesterase [Allosphingosinicella sp.]|nr:metallophosphoesterase [Allosphingosinicella sp.]
MSLRRTFLILIALAALLAIWGYATAVSVPIVRQARLDLPRWPAGAPPVKAVLISDIHVVGPDMPPERLHRIVAQINALNPDVVLIAGDLISDKRTSTRHYSMAEAIAPLTGLRPRLGSFAVLGNHDHWRNAGEARQALKAAGVRLLGNEAAAAGPLVIGGLDDDYTENSDLPGTLAKMARMKGARLILSHSPDPFPDVPRDVPLMVAGHTHCGQVSLPFYGAVRTFSRHGKRYECGIYKEGGKTLVITAGLGTSGVPLRLGAVPDMWLLELGPIRSDGARSPRR